MDKFKQVYCDIPFAKRDCQLARRFFQKHYNVLAEDIIEVVDTSFKETQAKYAQLEAMIKAEQANNKKVLVIHVLAGHGVQLDGMQSLLIN